MRRVIGTDERPRLKVFRSNRHIYAQIINDSRQKVITGVSTLAPQIRDKKISAMNKAEEVGKLVAQKAQKEKIKKVVFDRGKYKFHGQVKELAEGARKQGLEF